MARCWFGKEEATRTHALDPRRQAGRQAWQPPPPHAMQQHHSNHLHLSTASTALHVTTVHMHAFQGVED